MSDMPKAIDYSPPVLSTLSIHGIPTELISTLSIMTSAASWSGTAANTALFVPIRVATSISVANIFWINGAMVGTNHVDAGIYDSEGNQLGHIGSTLTSGASSAQSASLSLTLQRGIYYLAMVMDGTTDTVQQATSITQVPRAAGVYKQSTAFPLPSTATFAGSTSALVPFIGITSQGVV